MVGNNVHSSQSDTNKQVILQEALLKNMVTNTKPMAQRLFLWQ